MDLRVGKSSKTFGPPWLQQPLWAVLERTPQLEALAARARERLRPAITLLYGERRRLATVGVAGLTLWLFLHVMFGANGMVVYRQKRAEYKSLQLEIDGLQKENQASHEQVKALQTDPKTIEKEAREQLHYARPGEVVYVAPAPPPSRPPASSAARK